MLNRLPELRRAARLPEQPIALSTQHTMEENLVYVIASDERSVRALCADIRERVAELRRLGAEAKKAILPGRLLDLQKQLVAKDTSCQRLVHQSKDLLLTLEGNEQERAHDDLFGAGESLQRLRASAVSHWREQVKVVILEFFEVRGKMRDDIRVQQRRRLRFAYPEADEETLETALASPELASQAIGRRADGDRSSLRSVLASLDSIEDRQIEEAAKSLKLIFLQFAELVDAQGETFDEIEANIDRTIEHVENARVQLEEARVLQSKNWRQAVKLKVCGCCCAILLLAILAPSLFVRAMHLAIPKKSHTKHMELSQVNISDLAGWKWLNFTESIRDEAHEAKATLSVGDADGALALLAGSAKALGYRPVGYRPGSTTRRSQTFLWRGVAKPESVRQPEQQELRHRGRLGTGSTRLESLAPGLAEPRQ